MTIFTITQRNKEEWENALVLQNNPGGACTNLSQSKAVLRLPLSVSL